MPRCFVISLVLGIGFAADADAHETAALRSAMQSILEADLKSHVEVLAADSFEGREAGSRGGRAAAGYLQSKLQTLGLVGAAEEGGFYQTFRGRYRNILAKFPGSDPQLAHEVIVFGAHYDHVGYGSRSNSYGPTGYIHNGADDNASGTSALLEMAEAFTKLPVAPKRSIVFAFFDGEEKGLLGSKHWVANPTIPLGDVKAMINMDMIGRLRQDKVEVYGTRTATDLRRLISQQNSELNLRLDYTWEMKANSDHHSFYRHSIPALMFHTGLHNNYHRPSDDVHLVNTAGMERVSRLVFLTAYALADSSDAISFRAASRREGPAHRRALERPFAKRPSRLGIAWSSFDAEAQTLTISEVRPGSPAAAAGLRVGDRLQALNDQPIENEASFRSRVLAAPQSSTLTVLRDDAKAPIALSVKLRGQPIRIGLSWRFDAAETQSAVIAAVIPGSPAEAAGLRVKDRLESVNDKTFSTSNELKQLLQDTPSPLRLRIDRQGRILFKQLELHSSRHAPRAVR